MASQQLGDEAFETPYQVYRRLVDIVRNESSAPEVLPYEESLVDLTEDQIQHMKSNLEKHRPKLDPFCIEQHSMELERVSFVVREYLRIRLKKIEDNASTLVRLLKTDTQQALRILSPLEAKYLDRYITSIDDHLQRTVLNFVPLNMKSFRLVDVASNEKQEFDAHYVFVEALNTISVTVDDPIKGQEVVTMEKGSKSFLPYSGLRRHLISGSKDLLLL